MIIRHMHIDRMHLRGIRAWLVSVERRGGLYVMIWPRLYAQWVPWQRHFRPPSWLASLILDRRRR